ISRESAVDPVSKESPCQARNRGISFLLIPLADSQKPSIWRTHAILHFPLHCFTNQSTQGVLLWQRRIYQMRDAHTITVEKLIVHILDNSVSSPEPVLSNHECEITDDIAKFFAAHIEQSISEDRAKVAKFKRPDAQVKVCCDEIFDRS